MAKRFTNLNVGGGKISRLKQVQLTCKIIINCQRCVLNTLVRGFNVIEKFALLPAFPFPLFLSLFPLFFHFSHFAFCSLLFFAFPSAISPFGISSFRI